MGGPPATGVGPPGFGTGGGDIPPGDPPVVSPAIGQLVVIAGNTSFGTIALDDDLRVQTIEAGIDPLDIDRMRWPMGATRFASITVLLTKMQLDAIQEAVEADTLIRVGLGMSTLVFDRMYLRPPRGIIPREGDVLYACDIVDERYFWQKQGMPGRDDAFNVHTDRKSQLIEVPPDSGDFELFDSLYNSTTFEDTVPYTPRQLLQIFFNKLLPFGQAGEFNVYSQFVELDDHDAIRDLVAGDYSLGELIDRVLRATGMVLMAYPFVGYNTAISGSRYNVERVSEGVDAANFVLGDFVDRLLGGTLRSAPFGQADNPPRPDAGDGLGHYIVGEGSLLRSEIPERVDVHFPKASANGQYSFNKETATSGDGLAYVTERFFALGYTLQSLINDPEIGMGVDIHNGQVVSLVAGYWAVEDEDGQLINETKCLERGERIAANYYARFTSGFGDLLFAGLISIVPWAGILLMEWIISPRGLLTRMSGEIDDPLLGPQVAHTEPLSATSILSTGSVKALTRPDGGLLLDSPAPPVSGPYYRATITGVESDNFGLFYDAVANDDPAIEVSNVQPRMRLFNYQFYDPAPIGAPCTIVDIGGVFFLWEVAVEAARSVTCPVGAADEAGYAPSFIGL